MLAGVKSFALEGLNGYEVNVEVFSQVGIPAFDIVGLPGSSVKEARDRVRAAIKNSGLEFQPKKITVNLAPADVKKEGSCFDLPLAVGFLAVTGQLPKNSYENYVFFGELSLDGTLRRLNGILPMVISASQMGYKKFVMPTGNANEAAFIDGIEVYAMNSLSDVVNFLFRMGNTQPIPKKAYDAGRVNGKYDVDISDVKGQYVAKRALEIAVAGGHNLLLSGSPGTGKTMLAKCVPTIMPEMTFEEAIEATKIHSVAGLLTANDGIVTERPFRTPHHTASLFSLTGGTAKSLPGEVSLAHNGVLFLDEMPEYSRQSLEALRQPLEDGVISVSRVARTIEYPANFMLIASMNPCPCGYKNSKNPNKHCTCTPREVKKYVSRISGPLLDRIDLFVAVDDVEYNDLRSKERTENSATVRARVEKARDLQRKRFSSYEGVHTNSQMSQHLINEFCKIGEEAETLLERAFRSKNLSPRSLSRILKTSRTIADLEGAENIDENHIAEAIQYKISDLNELGD